MIDAIDWRSSGRGKSFATSRTDASFASTPRSSAIIIFWRNQANHTVLEGFEDSRVRVEKFFTGDSMKRENWIWDWSVGVMVIWDLEMEMGILERESDGYRERKVVELSMWRTDWFWSEIGRVWPVKIDE